MRDFLKYFGIFLAAQILFPAFVFFTWLVLDQPVGSSLLFFLYILPLYFFAGILNGGGGYPMMGYVAISVLGSVYAAIPAAFITFAKRFLSSGKSLS